MPDQYAMVARNMRRIGIVIGSVVIIAIVIIALANHLNHESGTEINSYHFYGNLSINGDHAPRHTTIIAKIGDRTCGATDLLSPGTYDLEVFARPGTKKYVSFWIKTSSMESAVNAAQKRTLPHTKKCLLDLTVEISDSDIARAALHTMAPGSAARTDAETNPAPATTHTPSPSPTPRTRQHQHDPMLWDVVISEVMWDEDEYLELYNTLDRTISIENWTITRGGGAVNDSIEVTLKHGAIIPSHGYYLIADKDAVTCEPDQITNLTLKNSGEVLQLFNGFPPVSKRIDVVNRVGNWFAGKNDDVGQSMERISLENGANPDNWYTSLGYECGRIGTPGKENSIPDRTPPEVIVVSNPIGANDDVVVSFNERIDISTLRISVIGPHHGWISGRIIGDDDMKGALFDPDNPLQAGQHSVMVTCRDPSDNFAERDFLLTVAGTGVGEPGDGSENESEDEPEPVPEPTPDPTPDPDPVVTARIVINELMPNPIGRDRGNETTELYNCGNEAVDISGWVIKNEDGDAHEIPAGKMIDAHGYYLTTEMQLDNTGGQVFLYRDSEEVDRSIAYTDSTEGESWQRRTDGLDTDSDGDWIERKDTFGVAA
ncbi:MAG: lamin tail domain-containing protein [Methanosarcinales archaeon]|nr:lamin tail domain-containing protein [Methanosarcinales archaeon]